MNHSAQKYKNKLRKKLRCTNTARERLLDSFDSTLEGYLDENPNASLEDLCNAFGPPEEMANILMEQVSSEEVAIYRRRKLCVCVIGVLLAVALIVMALIVFLWKEKPFIADDEGEIIDSFVIDDSVEIIDSVIIIDPSDNNKGE